jgi:CheY-like chemotaxis protein
VARQIRADQQFAGVVLIALTGWGQAGDRQSSKAAGFDHHLVKPVDFSPLQALLESIPPPGSKTLRH